MTNPYVDETTVTMTHCTNDPTHTRIEETS
jgi:hypothetical protein